MAKPKADTRTLIEQTKRAALARHKARYAELVALIRRRMGAVVEAFYDIGEALREGVFARAEVTLKRDTVRIEVTRAKAERLAKRG